MTPVAGSTDAADVPEGGTPVDLVVDAEEGPTVDALRSGQGRDLRWLELAMVLLRAGPVLVLLLLMVVLTILEPVFLTPRNIGNVLAQSAVISVLAMGQLLVIVTKGVDLSVGAVVALASVVGALAYGTSIRAWRSSL